MEFGQNITCNENYTRQKGKKVFSTSNCRSLASLTLYWQMTQELALYERITRTWWTLPYLGPQMAGHIRSTRKGEPGRNLLHMNVVDRSDAKEKKIVWNISNLELMKWDCNILLEKKIVFFFSYFAHKIFMDKWHIKSVFVNEIRRVHLALKRFLLFNCRRIISKIITGV